ncbi:MULTISPECIES: hypothetical protein [unclassified Chryseobacterium]|uniref:hypothetical protein n=1 Tax=unclassified Chryseobacterium TaxID=2593645 RepID=UPI002852F5F6|nr:hypothetical protein [Chryseobacterium sp. CFS7]MDR4894347.1 hypothetical protein [Chryseobacterium sp. CFS7]
MKTKTKTNVFLDFDNTQFDGHLHNTMMKYFYNSDDILHELQKVEPELTKDQLIKELKGEAPLTPTSKYAVQLALKSAKNDVIKENEKLKAEGKREKPVHTFDFFEGQSLNKLVKERKEQGVDVAILTASMFPGAIKAINEIKGLIQLNDIPMIVVPIVSNGTTQQNKLKMAQYKNTEIQKYERAQRANIEGLIDVKNIFVDDSKENIEVFTKSKNPNSIGMLAAKGLNKELMEKLNNAIEKALEQQAAISKQRSKEKASYVEDDIYANVNQDIYANVDQGLYANASELRSGKNDLSKFTETQNKPAISPKLSPKPSPKLPPRAKAEQASAAPARTQRRP